MVKGLIEFALSMLYIEISIIALLIILQTGFIIFLHRGMIRAVGIGLKNLDSSIAEAIEKVLSGELPNIDPVNPMQAMIMQLIQDKMTNNNPNIDIIRDEHGKFK